MRTFGPKLASATVRSLSFSSFPSRSAQIWMNHLALVAHAELLAHLEEPDQKHMLRRLAAWTHHWDRRWHHSSAQVHTCSGNKVDENMLWNFFFENKSIKKSCPLAQPQVRLEVFIHPTGLLVKSAVSCWEALFGFVLTQLYGLTISHAIDFFSTKKDENIFCKTIN